MEGDSLAISAGANPAIFGHIKLRSRSGMHLCMPDDQNGQKTMVLPSADKTRLTRFILSKKSLVANGLVWQLMVTPL
jgi:hypothetical protein